VAYDTTLAARINAILADRTDTVAKKMFGGVAFMVADHMACGIVRDELMVRVGPEAYDAALTCMHVRPMDFVGRPMKGMVYIAPDGIRSDDALAEWVAAGVSYALALPPKPARRAKPS
jgi:TfoX/Sxy family transcriptional regulator of competence genes